MDIQKRRELASQVQPARKARRWYQKELAEAAKVSVGTISSIERGLSVPTASTLQPILDALDIDTGDATARATRAEWTDDVAVFLDVIGLYLAGLEAEDRHVVMRELTTWLFARSRK